MIATECVRTYLPHDFDYWSGWCKRGCGNRDDGRIVSRSGELISSGPEYNEAGLEKFRTRLERKK